MTNPADAILDLHRRIDLCTRCQAEVGHGYAKIRGLRRGSVAGVMVVGEQPGSNEAARAVAFAGPAGKVLEKWLVASGADPDEPRRGIYFTSLIKCVAPKRATAFKRMVRNCRGFLAEQIETLTPSLVITLGRPAYEWFAEAGVDYGSALCNAYESSTDPIRRRHQATYVVLPWPHPSPSNNRLLYSAGMADRMRASFDIPRPFFEGLR
jgi:uracil-DNA glycosylase family 4